MDETIYERDRAIITKNIEITKARVQRLVDLSRDVVRKTRMLGILGLPVPTPLEDEARRLKRYLMRAHGLLHTYLGERMELEADWETHLEQRLAAQRSFQGVRVPDTLGVLAYDEGDEDEDDYEDED